MDNHLFPIKMGMPEYGTTNITDFSFAPIFNSSAATISCNIDKPNAKNAALAAITIPKKSQYFLFRQNRRKPQGLVFQPIESFGLQT